MNGGLKKLFVLAFVLIFLAHLGSLVTARRIEKLEDRVRALEGR